MSHRAALAVLLFASLSIPSFSQGIPANLGRRAGISASLSGTVRTSDDKPVSDARIEVRDAGLGSVVASGYTNANGTFEFDSLAAGNYEVVATSGVDSATERVAVQSMMATVSLRLPLRATAADGSATVSVNQLRIPEKAFNENKKAREAMDKSDTASAWKHVTKALEIAPKFAAALVTRALLELDSNKTAAAMADLENGVQVDPGYGLTFLVLGATYNRAQRFDDAIRTLDHGLALMPNHWQGYFEMAKAYLGKNDLEHAKIQLDHCAALAPADYAPLHLVRANLDLALKNYNDAMAELEAYLDKNPNSPSSEAARKTLAQVKAFVAQK